MKGVLISGLAVFSSAAFAVMPRGVGNTMIDSPWKPLPIWGGGYVQNVIFSPSSSNVLYSYADVSGPWRSDNSGREWYALSQNFTLSQISRRAYQVRGISVDPRDENSFVLVSGSGGSKSYPAGVYVSRDGGRSFRLKCATSFHAQGANLRPLGMVVARNPNNPDDLITGEDKDGLYMSRDNGETWRNVGNSLESYWFTDMRWDLFVPGRIYACAPSFRQGEKAGFFRSDDNGATWQKIAEDSPWEMFQMAGDIRVIAVFGGADVRVTIDGGETWTDFSQGLPRPEEAKPGLGDRGCYHACAAGRDFFLLGDGDGNIHRRGREEAEWKPVSAKSFVPGCPDEEPFLSTRAEWILRRKGYHLRPEHLSSLVVDPRNEHHWMATDWFVIWETHDEGRHWTSMVKGLAPTVPFTVSCDPFDPDGIVAGFADMGLLVSRDGGRSFNLPAFGYWCNTVAWSHKTKGFALASGGKRDITFSRTFDGGQTWELLHMVGLPKLCAFSHAVFSVAAHPVQDVFFIAVSGPIGKGLGGIYRSDDKGDTWHWFGDGLPSGVSLFKGGEFKGGYDPEIVISPNGDMVVRSSITGKAYYRSNSDVTWRQSRGVRDAKRQIAADPSRAGRFLLCGREFLMESLDGGRSFTECQRIPGNWLHMAFDLHRKGWLVIGDNDRILLSKDGGASFTVLDDQFLLPMGAVRQFDLDRGRLFFRTDGNGILMRRID